jgi:RNA polymerase sigma factor (sigma-70 family)
MGSSDDRGEAWFTRLYADHYPDIVRYGLRRLGNVEASTELAQEVFVVAWRRRHEVAEPSLPWLYGVGRRLLANQRRQTYARPLPLPRVELAGTLTGVGDADTVVALMDLRRALGTLAEPDQEILRLVGWEQLSTAEVAMAMGCSRSTAAVRLYRARRRLAVALTGSSPTTVAAPAAVRS